MRIALACDVDCVRSGTIGESKREIGVLGEFFGIESRCRYRDFVIICADSEEVVEVCKSVCNESTAGDCERIVRRVVSGCAAAYIEAGDTVTCADAVISIAVVTECKQGFSRVDFTLLKSIPNGAVLVGSEIKCVAVGNSERIIFIQTRFCEEVEAVDGDLLIGNGYCLRELVGSQRGVELNVTADCERVGLSVVSQYAVIVRQVITSTTT